MNQRWVVSVRYWHPGPGQRPDVERFAVVGPARSSTIEAVLHLASVPEDYRPEIRSHKTVRDFIEGKLDASRTGYYVESPTQESNPWRPWLVCIGPVHEVLPP